VGSSKEVILVSFQWWSHLDCRELKEQFVNSNLGALTCRLMLQCWKGHFKLLPSVELAKDSSYLIGQEQKFVLRAFTLEANNQWMMPSKDPIDSILWLLVSRVCHVEERCQEFVMCRFVQDENANSNTSWNNKLFFPNLYKLYNLYILMDLYLVFGPLDPTFMVEMPYFSIQYLIVLLLLFTHTSLFNP
jgi:hypothetical protein